jgi:2-hydroxychromene-2-carboxylate isomerase
VAYGDFNCPWSYLASRRADRLADAGVEIDWRAVEHDPPSSTASSGSARGEDRLLQARADVERVVELLLPGEHLPYALAGFVPDTGAAVAAYAESYAAGQAAPVRRLLFDALWLHSMDLDDAQVVHTIVVDAIGDGALPAGSSTARALQAAWSGEWHGTGTRTVPVVVVDGADPLFGVDAVRRLGIELLDPAQR